ncbi:MAG: ATP-binding protein [Dehalococcoidales bacterium]|nr:ATP-binding protein [Dehalococcoidales bacterium]
MRYSGYTREELIGHPTLETDRWIDPVERTAMRQKLETEGRVRNMEINSITKTGELRQGLLSAETVQIGGLSHVIALIDDVTEQRRSQKLLYTISENSPLGIYIIQDDILQYANPQFQAMTGCTESELLGRKLLDLVLPEDSGVILASTENTLENDHSFPCEFRLLGNNPTPRWVVQSVAPIFYNGRKAVLGNLMDISQRKFLERKITEYEALSKMKSDLLAMVSHELRTPLTTIKGYSTMILDYYARLEPEEMKDYLESIDSATDRLTKLVDNLLDTSRMEAGLLQFDKQPANIGRLVREVATEARLRTKVHEITMVVDRALPRIPIDQRRIRQILDNLVENAIKYSPRGEKIVISVKHIGNEVRVSVSDNGPGIPSGELTNIFKSMYRLEQHRDKGVDGMGLGLYISQRLVEAHGGTIWAESPAGHGSIITFTLPDESTDNRAAVRTPKMARTLRGGGNPNDRLRERR